MASKYENSIKITCVQESLYPRNWIISSGIRKSLYLQKFIPMKLYTNKVIISEEGIFWIDKAIVRLHELVIKFGEV